MGRSAREAHARWIGKDFGQVASDKQRLRILPPRSVEQVAMKREKRLAHPWIGRRNVANSSGKTSSGLTGTTLARGFVETRRRRWHPPEVAVDGY
jgi:hypothetical protein